MVFFEKTMFLKPFLFLSVIQQVCTSNFRSSLNNKCEITTSTLAKSFVSPTRTPFTIQTKSGQQAEIEPTYLSPQTDAGNNNPAATQPQLQSPNLSESVQTGISIISPPISTFFDVSVNSPNIFTPSQSANSDQTQQTVTETGTNSESPLSTSIVTSITQTFKNSVTGTFSVRPTIATSRSINDRSAIPIPTISLSLYTKTISEIDVQENQNGSSDSDEEVRDENVTVTAAYQPESATTDASSSSKNETTTVNRQLLYYFSR
jgi:hypothetical protein